MKTSAFPLFLLAMLGVLRCAEPREQPVEAMTEGPKRIPIPYEFAQLGLFLNGSIYDYDSLMYWKWDHLRSPNSVGCDTAVCAYFCLDRPEFVFNGRPTEPSLYVITDGGKIKEFSASLIIYLEDGRPEELAALLDSLSMIDLLRNPHVRQSMMDHHQFKRAGEGYEEELELEISKEKYSFDHVHYRIRVHPFERKYEW
jgi:hypothetical protein